MRFSFTVLSFLLCVFTCVGSAQVVINEVLFFEDPANDNALLTHQWLELYNASTDPVDLTGWSVTGADGINGASPRALPAVMLPPGAYLVVHFTSGQNQLDFSQNSGDYYTSDDSTNTPYWSVDQDEAALYSPNGIVDFINWARAAITYTPGAAHDDAVAANIWTAGAVLLHDRIGAKLEVLRYVQPGDSIGRDLNSTDTDQPSDFDALGGPSGLGPTPGGQNLTPAPVLALTESQAGSAANPPLQGASPGLAPRSRDAAPAQKKWTVLLFMSSDNNLESWFIKKLQRVQNSGGSSADVNFVTMWDAKSISATTWRGRIGPPRNDNKVAFYNPDGQSADIGERDMGDPQELQGFIAWAKQNYPADRYALVLSSHGDGWKSFGPDQTFPSGTREKQDSLYMGELSTALAGQNFQWIAFDACLMAAVEVAHQLQPFANYLLSSEEITYATDFPYEAMVQDMTANPDWDGKQSITDIFNRYVHRVQNMPADANDTDVTNNAEGAKSYTVSVMDLSAEPDLSGKIPAWADLLAPGMSLFQKRDDPTDNVQILTANQLAPVEKFDDHNFIDLYHFSQLMQKSGIPDCLLTPVPGILDSIQQRVVILESHGSQHPNAHGVHIYFPRFRMLNLPFRLNGGVILFPNPDDQPYDLPDSRTVDGSSPLAHYGVRQDALPLAAKDPETGQDFDAGIWPLPQSPGFKFPNDTGWHKVLNRFYHPAADNHITMVVGPDGANIPVVVGAGSGCTNPIDEITVPVGSTVTFSGAGSSDADQQAAVNPPAPNIAPTHYFWDQDASVEECPAPCWAPSEVPNFSDAAVMATNIMDQDRSLTETLWDEKNAEGKTFTRKCDLPKQYIVTLIPWDDDHLFPFHNTAPTARYVHPQTNVHQAIINCQTVPTTLLVEEQPQTIWTNQPVDIYYFFKFIWGGAGLLQPKSFVQNSDDSVPNYPVVISTTAGSPTIQANGTTINPGTSATIPTDSSGTIAITFRATAPGPGQIAVKAVSGPSKTISFTVSPGSPVTNVAVTPPAGNSVAVNQSATIGVRVTNNGQPVANAPVGFESVFNNIGFTSGSSYQGGSASQVTTDATGSAQVGIVGKTPGAEQIVIIAGAFSGVLNLTVSGTPSTTPTGVGVLSVPDMIDVGQQATVSAIVVAQNAGLPGAKVTFQAVQGHVSFTGSPTASQVTVTTDAQGQAKATFVANDPTPVQITISVNGTQLSTSVSIPVRLPPL